MLEFLMWMGDSLKELVQLFFPLLCIPVLFFFCLVMIKMLEGTGKKKGGKHKG